MVRVDGDWYCIDVTWDDTDSEDYDGGAISYAYFLVTTDFMSDRVLYADNIALPTATATKHNFYIKNGFYANNTNEIKDVIFNSAVTSFREGRNYIYFRAADAETYNAALNLVNSQEIFTILRNASSASGKNVDVRQISFLHSEERKTITIIIK